MIKFVQFVLPNERSLNVEKMAKYLVEKDYRFEAKVTKKNEISFSCERTIPEKTEVIAIEVSPSGPEVFQAVDKLIEKAYKKINESIVISDTSDSK